MWVTATEVREFKIAGSIVDLTAYSDDEIEEAIIQAQDLITLITKRTFELSDTGVAKRFNGDATSELCVVPTYPGKIHSVSAVALLDGDDVIYTYNADDYVVRPFSILLREGPLSVRIASSVSGQWPRGLDNIRITGQWGETCPAAVKRAVKALTLETLIPGSSGYTGDSIKREKWEDYEVEYLLDKGVTSTGFVAIDQLLAPYVVSSSLFRVVC